jgi:hypothetical protein
MTILRACLDDHAVPGSCVRDRVADEVAKDLSQAVRVRRERAVDGEDTEVAVAEQR